MRYSKLCTIVVAVSVCSTVGGIDRGDCFFVRVVDDETSRGVPLVELRTTNELRFFTDSNGIVAIDEPGLFGNEVYFHISSHGYEFPADGFSFRGVRLQVSRGGNSEIRLKRLNIAERLYRVTGEGIYRDSVVAEQPFAIEHPVLNGRVVGQDSVLAVPYRGKLFWVWGDTTQVGYPLGNFGAAGATSEFPPPRGEGLDPAAGVNLRYFLNESGFSRPMVAPDAVPGPGPKWLGGLTTIRDGQGNERLIAKYVRVKDLSETLERGLVLYNDDTESFDRLTKFDLDAPLYLDGHPFRVTVNGTTYIYCGYNVPSAIRVRDDLKDLSTPGEYEGFSPLIPGSRYNKAATKLDRTPDGRLNYAWKRNTPPLDYEQQEDLVRSGKLRRDEVWLTLQDFESGTLVRPHAGSVRWNEYRRKWVMIVQQSFGSSNLGEIWYAEADTPIGPWVYARKVVTHDKYSFYNPVHHKFFDQDGGRRIYFEGTYSELFAGSPLRTPRYDYNQIMYRLTLDDARLSLPSPVYQLRGESGLTQYRLVDGVEKAHAWNEVVRVAFFAMAPQRPHSGLVPIYGSTDDKGSMRLKTSRGEEETDSAPLFYAVSNSDGPALSPAVVPLYEYVNRRNGGVTYSTHPLIKDDAQERAESPICRVWVNPVSVANFDRGARHE